MYPYNVYRFTAQRQAANSVAVKDPDQLQSKQVQWEGITFSVPKKIDFNASHTMKSRYFHATVKAIKEASKGSGNTKCDVLSSRFDTGKAKLKEAKDLLVDIHQPGSHIDIGKALFQYVDPVAIDRDGKPVSLPSQDLPPIPCPVDENANDIDKQAYEDAINKFTSIDRQYTTACRSVRFLRFRVITNPSDVCSNCKAATFQLEVIVSIPVNASGNAVSQEAIDFIKQGPAKLLYELKQFYGHPPDVALLGKIPQVQGIYFDTNGFRRQFIEWFSQCVLDLFISLQEEAYLGTMHEANLSVAMNKIKQIYYNQSTQQLVSLSVDQFHTKFINALADVPAHSGNYDIDMAQVFHSNLREDIRKQLETENYFGPPTRPNDSTTRQRRAIQEIFQKAKIAEQKEANIRSTIQRFSNSSRLRIKNAAAFPQFSQEDIAEEAIESPFQSPQDHYSHHMIEAATYLSACEDSMQRATGESRPMLECWGCKGSTRFHANRFHIYRDCPNKDDPEVQQNAQKRIEEFCQKSRSNKSSGYYGPQWTTIK